MLKESFIEQQIKFFERLSMSEAHGSMKLQMFDHLTGKETESIEKNMITNLYKDYIESLLSMWSSAFTTNLYFNNVSSLVPNNFAGGILLFDAVQTENVNNYIPVGNCIGHAGSGYTGPNIYRGNYNTTYSGQLGNKWTRVWEFETDKANGTINSVCLCPINGGNQGYRNGDINGNSTLDNASGSLGNFGYANVNSGGIFVNFIKYLKTTSDLKTIYYQSGAVTNGTAYLRKLITPDPSSILYLGTPQMKADTATAPSLNIPYGQYCWLEFAGSGMNTLYGLWFNSSTRALTLKTYDLSLNELSSLSLNNPNNVYVYISPNSNYGIIGNMLYVLDNSNHTMLHCWNLTTNTYSSINIPYGLVLYSINTFNENNVFLSNTGSDTNGMLFNGTNWLGPWYDNYGYCYRQIPNKPVVFAMSANQGTLTSNLFNMSFFTINNLGSPVTKTNSNSMKITYEITFNLT